MKPETIKAIFTNLLFVIGVVLVVVGFVQGARTVTKLIVFDKYPLDSWEESKCTQPPYIPAPAADGGKTEPIVTDPRAGEDCKGSLEQERKVKETEDIVGSISMLVAGSALVYFFRRFILK